MGDPDYLGQDSLANESGMIAWLRSLFFCPHYWKTVFRGTVTRGVVCTVCGKAELQEDWNDGSEPLGWRE